MAAPVTAALRGPMSSVTLRQANCYYSSEKSTDAPLAADGGVTEPSAVPADPFQALDELMVVVEELCPVWPARPTFTNEGANRL